jgi:hypothetical protein
MLYDRALQAVLSSSETQGLLSSFWVMDEKVAQIKLAMVKMHLAVTAQVYWV